MIQLSGAGVRHQVVITSAFPVHLLADTARGGLYSLARAKSLTPSLQRRHPHLTLAIGAKQERVSCIAQAGRRPSEKLTQVAVQENYLVRMFTNLKWIHPRKQPGHRTMEEE